MIEHFLSVAKALDWMQWLLLWFLAFIPVLLFKAHLADDAFDLRHLIADPATDKIDRFAFSYVVALTISSWVVLFYANAGKLTYEFLGVYIVAFVAPKAFETWINSRAPKA